ncbi:MAG TPA: WS/DGAT domain-containing protein [Mycobacterium sp.]|uniref:WS/DGAT domain-containing protein n=1 Tax=Mycolicibacterium sp. TaxID=2320850 RepID=UPI0025E735A7|nr:WS/DGAT domain-containing protein [Mycolicibacterium sp.]HPX38034.1 WS/DGAT domain-containing protein [Mycobacterium sp.]HQC77315.1 WS/DGAT domain-containing protein [Mycobacterium sp.]
MRVMAAADAQLLWLSATMPNDQFLLYAFDGEVDSSAIGEVAARARACDELRLRVRDDHRWRYPRWVAGDVDPEQFVAHGARDWQGCLDALPGLDALDVQRMSWRLHVFPPNVVVVQMSHALGDGNRSAALAAVLLGRPGRLPVVPDTGRGFLPWRALVAARAHRQLVADTDDGVVARPAGTRPALSVNERPQSSPALRTLVLDRHRLHRPTVTVAALVAISEALGGYLAERGEDTGRLGAEVPMSLPKMNSNNNFRNVGVGLYPELNRDDRAARIGAELASLRRRGEHPAMRASAAAFAAVPAPLLRWGMGKFDPTVRASEVTGNTVVSSVNRGPADLTFGGRRVLFTAGYPALSPMMSLTHGVHGIGDTVAVSVHADSGNVDVDGYLDRLTHALGCQP